jgi:glutamate carboxypeptidase
VALIRFHPRTICLLFAGLIAVSPPVIEAQPIEPVIALARKEKAPLLETLKALCDIESGSRDLEGLDQLANLIASRSRGRGDQLARLAQAPYSVGRGA